MAPTKSESGTTKQKLFTRERNILQNIKSTLELRAMYIMHKRDGISGLADFFDGMLEGLDFAREKLSEFTGKENSMPSKDKYCDKLSQISKHLQQDLDDLNDDTILPDDEEEFAGGVFKDVLDFNPNNGIVEQGIIKNAKLSMSNLNLKRENDRLLSRNIKLRLLLHRVLDRSGDFKINLSQDINETNKRIYDRINDFRSNLSKDIHEILDN